ncbi:MULTISPECIES: ParB/RepB/Spo0J family partition protein [Micrococcaceae]|jgi:ParB family chromosome partitioning protein|uniref:ParB n=3 Tax=Micrococcaceae TaxID=1268 RepID=Q6SK32_PAEAU|nr:MULTISPECIES: ParB/RepB/Spo0J family partition protein [Micrococcaceae]AAS20140.1 ParB [Paenarthrobacter aurescens]SDQ03496.1 chromosome partitioning protein, ParB family [Arthrobacter crystallopoietes]
MNATPTLEMIDPATLSVDINVRKDAALTADFIASIKEHGVMEPVIAHRKDDGTVHVLMGQRRTRAAVEAGLTSIPVMIIDSPEEAERIVTQVVENIQRAGLTEADEADAYHQLSLIGVSASVIARKTGRTKSTVESAIKAKTSDTGAAALGKGHTIEEALILAEFEADEDATGELESVIRDEPDMLAHVAQQLRDRRESAAALTALTAELEAAGTTVVDAPGYGTDSDNLAVTSLNRADGERASDEDANAVYIQTRYDGTHYTIPVVAGWKELGFMPRHSYLSPSPATKGPMTEEQKAERKTLIENNKAMQSATTVRHGFVKTLLARKQAPKGWQYFTVHAITHHPETASSYDSKTAEEMLGAKTGESSGWGWNPLRDHVAKSTARPEFSLLALVCAGYEKTIAKDSWRSPGQTHRDYLNQLITWGYTPSEVEQIILDSGAPAEDDTAA